MIRPMTFTACFLLPALIVSPLPVMAQGGDEAVELQLSFRPRYEFVGQENFSNDANALTVRTLAGMQLRPSATLTGQLTVINVAQLTDDFNDTRNGKLAYPVVPDPANTDINELHLTYSGVVRIRAGRQIVGLSRSRFIGAKDFRQTMQVFDGVTADFALPGNQAQSVNFYSAWFDRVSNVTATSRDENVGIVRADWAWSSGNNLLASVYWHDKNVQPAGTDTSYRISSVRWDGLLDAAYGAQFNYVVQYAEQRPHANSSEKIRSHYAHAGAGVIWPSPFVRVDYEILASNDGTYGFQAPLANSHAYQGWADRFVVTPDEGVRDLWVTFGSRLGSVSWVVEHHRLESDYAQIDFGYETDAGVTWSIRSGLSLTLQIADYRNGGDPGNALPNTTKAWVTLVWVVSQANVRESLPASRISVTCARAGCRSAACRLPVDRRSLARTPALLR